MNIIVDYFKQTGHLPCHHHHHFVDDLESIVSTGFKQPPERALEWLKNRGKNLKITTNWDELDASAHEKAFTVAKVMTADLLQDFYNLVEKAKSEGWTLDKFKSEAMPYAEKTGWSAGSTMNRLRTIYQTNMDMAYAQGKYQQQKLLADKGLYPYLEYVGSTAMEPDPLHEQYYGLILRFDDPFWRTHFPPSRYGCQCSTRSVSQKEIDKRGLDVTNGNDYLQEILKDPELAKQYEIQSKTGLRPLDAWEPKTDFYVDGLKKELEKVLVGNKISKPIQIEGGTDTKPSSTKDDLIKGLISDRLKRQSKEKFLKRIDNIWDDLVNSGFMTKEERDSYAQDKSNWNKFEDIPEELRNKILEYEQLHHISVN